MDRFYMNGAAALFKGASLLAISPICMCHDIHAGGVNYASWVQLTRKLRLGHQEEKQIRLGRSRSATAKGTLSDCIGRSANENSRYWYGLLPSPGSC